MLLGIEMMFIAIHLNCMVFAHIHSHQREITLLFLLFTLIIALCETAMFLMMAFKIHQKFQTISLKDVLVQKK